MTGRILVLGLLASQAAALASFSAADKSDLAPIAIFEAPALAYEMAIALPRPLEGTGYEDDSACQVCFGRIDCWITVAVDIPSGGVVTCWDISNEVQNTR